MFQDLYYDSKKYKGDGWDGIGIRIYKKLYLIEDFTKKVKLKELKEIKKAKAIEATSFTITKEELIEVSLRDLLRT